MRLFCCSHLLALQCIRYCLISDIRLLRWQWNFKEKSHRLQTCQKISDKYISVSMIRVSRSLRKNPLPGMTKFCATLILLVLIQLHHCLHHETTKPGETSSPKGKLVQPVISPYTYVWDHVVEYQAHGHSLPCRSPVLVLNHVFTSDSQVITKPIGPSEE